MTYLGTCFSAVHDGMATVSRPLVLHLFETVEGEIITRINHPSVSLLKDCRSKVFVRVPPVGWAGGRAAKAENALVKTIDLFTVLHRLHENLLADLLLSELLLLEVGLDPAVLSVEVGHIRHKILNNIHVGQWVDLASFGVLRDGAKASQTVAAVNVH